MSSARCLVAVLLTAGMLLAWMGVSEALASNDIVRVQQALKDKGFDPGPVDGIMGPATRNAIRDFQRANGLEVTGRLDAATQGSLGVEIAPTIRVPSGHRIHVTLNERLSSGTAQQGQRFSMTVSDGVAVGNQVAIPAGAVVTGVVEEVQPAQRPQAGGKLVLRAQSLRVRGETVSLTGHITGELEGEGSLKEDIKKIGIGAAAGGVLGGLIKGRRGALVGVIVGGTGTFLGTKGEEVDLPVETPLIVELTGPAEVPQG